MWVLFVMPQRRRQTAQRQMLADIELGDEIVTVGGIIGHVRGLDDDEVLLEIAPETTIRLARRAVAVVVPPDADEEDVEEPAEAPPGAVEAESR
jgi:preprotein translocase subunit YajC